jgi:hypothetical protein
VATLDSPPGPAEQVEGARGWPGYSEDIRQREAIAVSDLAELLKGIAALAWPCAFVTAVLLFRGEIRSILDRLRKGKFLGQEIELDKSLDELERESATVASATQPSSPRAAEETGEVERRVLAEGSRSPKLGLLLLSAELERAVRQLLASTGNRPLSAGPLPLRPALTELVSRKMLPEPLGGSIRQFVDVRNRIVHGGPSSDEEAIRALDSGLSLLRAVRAIPHEVNVVHHPGVEVFADSEGRQLVAGVLALVLETTSPGGATKALRVFPTTRADYVKGQRVSWEWNPGRIFGESWYRNPDTALIAYGWGSSMEFTGKPII